MLTFLFVLIDLFSNSPIEMSNFHQTFAPLEQWPKPPLIIFDVDIEDDSYPVTPAMK